MAIVNMKEMLQDARKGGYGIGAFNILDYNSMKAVILTAEEMQSPVIIQTSVKTVVFWGFEPIISWYKDLASKVKVPVAIHLDHCKDLDFVSQCIENGWTSVMIDASSYPLDKNIELSATVLKMAHPRGVSVEAELGEIGGVEDDLIVKEEDAHLADPRKVSQFLEQVPVDCFAPAIGTAHGMYKGEPKVAFDRLKIISQANQTPLALHGGTGLSDDVFKKCIALGCAKVNISTELKYNFIDGFVQYHQNKPNQYDPLNVLAAQFEQISQMVAKYIQLFKMNIN
ncbi:MAG: class II fructose-bisphosphate aldolase [Candidatus Cyclobacteriaceae bacterium M3_2C_046]